MMLKKGDHVLILAGKDKNKKGKIVKVLPIKDKIIVDKLNTVKKHIKPKKQGEKGTRLEISMPFPASRAMIVCPNCSKPTRQSVKFIDNKKVRICKKCQAEI
ncbi:50S ribosomal protein L24 [Candidatus Azambacteria bacterium]|nr:50S ribosomal protein L24 [Candidatus Azambacteria bacterium]